MTDPRSRRDRAFANLVRGVRFLKASPHPEGRYRIKVLANHLRELDRLLNLLVDEVAIEIDALQFRREPLSRQRNTAAKLASLRIRLALPNPDDRRLRAIGRSRDCLFHNGGVIRRADRPGTDLMTAGWFDHEGTLRRFAVGQHLIVGKPDLDDVCTFYGRIADDLMAACPQ